MKANTLIMFDEFLRSINFSLDESLMNLNLESIEKIKKCKSPDILLRSYKEICDAYCFNANGNMANNLVLEKLVSDRNYLSVRLIKLLKNANRKLLKNLMI